MRFLEFFPKIFAVCVQTFAAVTAALCFAGVAQSVNAQMKSLGERRVALVVGNSSYAGSPLKNPSNDARAMAAMLRRHNFEVIERQNVTREAFATATREFGDKLKGATVALFYFAGHGLQVKGRNYLVPVDANIAREDEVPYRSLDVNEVLDKMDSARTPINLVLLDACRNNPFARSFKLNQMGLAQMDAPAGTLIAFATSPGSVAQDGEGENGLYTSALLRHIGTDALPIEQMLKRVRVDVVRASNNAQVPWESSSLNRDFAFAGGVLAVNGADAINSSAAANTDLVAELAFWDAIKVSTNPADYRAYLEQYPQGRFAPLAKVRANPGNTAAVSPSQGSTTPPKSIVRATSPEGLYRANLWREQLTLTDLRGVVYKAVSLTAFAGLDAERLLFSPDGRWLLVSGRRDGKTRQLLLGVSTAKLVLDRESLSATFDELRPMLQLHLPEGGFESVSLNFGG